jgi:molybdopterin-guanine dinucleotide biosynthesis protein A
MNCSAAILAGGLSTRFGTDKALFPVNRIPMISRVHNRLSELFDHVFVAGGNSVRFCGLDIEYVADEIPGKGILSGLHTALHHASTEWVFCCACDMPLINLDVAQVLLDQRDRHDILMPVIAGLRQPLHAIYRRNILPAVERTILSQQDHLPEMLASLSVRFLEETHFSHIPDFELSFVNINDQNAFQQYRPLIERT